MKTVGFIVALIMAITLAGCAGGPSPASTAPVTCDLLSTREVSFLTPTRANNPYYPISGLLRGTADEFAVVRVRLDFPDATPISLDGTVTDQSDTAVALLQTYDQMVRYWDIAEDLPARDRQIRSDALQRYYPSALSFTARKGRSEYVIVFKGKSPMPRPATVTVSVGLGDAQPQVFSFPLPPKEKGIFGLGS